LGISSSGTLLWEKEYETNPIHSSAYAIAKSSNNNYLIGGDFSYGADQDFFLLMTDVDGCYVKAPRIGRDSINMRKANKI